MAKTSVYFDSESVKSGNPRNGCARYNETVYKQLRSLYNQYFIPDRMCLFFERLSDGTRNWNMRALYETVLINKSWGVPSSMETADNNS